MASRDPDRAIDHAATALYHRRVAAKRCQSCQLINPESARCCDCGFSFADGSMGLPLVLAKPDVQTTSNRATAVSMARVVLYVVIALVVAGVVAAVIRLTLRGN